MERSPAALRSRVNAGSTDPGIRRSIALDQLEHLDRGTTLTHLFQCLLEVAEPLGRGNGDDLIGPEWFADPYGELVIRSVDNAFVRSVWIQGLYRPIAGDVEHQERALRHTGHQNVHTCVASMDLIVGQKSHRLRSPGGKALEPVDCGYAVDDAGEVGTFNPAGNDVSTGEHIERRRVPNEVRIVFGADHLKACLPTLQIGQEITLVA